MSKIINKIYFTILLNLAFATAVNAAEEIHFEVEKYKLDNGLTVLIHENHTMPLVSFHQWFRVGSSYEKPGRTGLAHFFEHLMFKGTKKYPKNEFDKIIQMNGGSYNAFTTEDYTGYYTNLPSDKLEIIIDVESDRMRNLIITDDEIKPEREVVKEERRMRYENSVMGSLFEQVRQTLYKVSPYKWPVIGYTADLNAAKLSEFQEFYNKYYVPNNAVVVVAGAVNKSQVKKLIEKYYGPIPKAQDFVAPKLISEPAQTAPRESQISRQVQGRTFALVYPGVRTGNADSHALDVLTSVLGSGTSSRLYKKLIYKHQLATSVSVYSQNKVLSGDLSIYVSLRPGASEAKAMEALYSELAEIKKNLISESELDKVKNQIKLSYVKGLETMAERAHSLALNEILFSDYQVLFDDIKKYNAVTIEDVRRVANQYIKPQSKNIIRVIPTQSATGAQ